MAMNQNFFNLIYLQYYPINMERIPCKQHLLEIGNFKPYEGSHTNGPMMTVIVIVSPDGSGK